VHKHHCKVCCLAQLLGRVAHWRHLCLHATAHLQSHGLTWFVLHLHMLHPAPYCQPPCVPFFGVLALPCHTRCHLWGDNCLQHCCCWYGVCFIGRDLAIQAKLAPSHASDRHPRSPHSLYPAPLKSTDMLLWSTSAIVACSHSDLLLIASAGEQATAPLQQPPATPILKPG